VVHVNPLKARFAAGHKAYAAWTFSGNADIVEAVARAGYHAVILCLEHGPGDTGDLGHLLRAVTLAGAEPIVRVPSTDPAFLKRVLDGGARSIMVPMVETVDEARRVVAACRYPPRGTRGYAATVVRGSSFGWRKDYAKTAHEDLFLALQIESLGGVACAEEMAGLDGVDMIFIGPNDLAASMGHIEDMSQPAVLAAVDRGMAAVKRTGKPVGIVPHGGRDSSACAALGFDMVADVADMALIRLGAAADVARHGKAFGIGH
jgi:4-hydroxy-2-oxoheptanedioate aldolase